jgi:hypothetical protein
VPTGKLGPQTEKAERERLRVQVRQRAFQPRYQQVRTEHIGGHCPAAAGQAIRL